MGAALRAVLLCAILLATAALADRVGGRFVAPGLIFPPNAVYFYRGRYFSTTVFTNTMGFRDRNFQRTRESRHRVLAVGDSFTYGWGLNLDDTWPKVLERELQTGMYDVEVANLGQPDADPYLYAQNVERALEVLDADLVVVAVVQADDIAQMGRYSDDELAAARHPPWWRRLGRRLLPTLSASLQGHAYIDEVFVDSTHVTVAEEHARRVRAGRQTLERFDALPPDRPRPSAAVRQLLLEGEIDCNLPYLALIEPDMFVRMAGTEDPQVAALTARAADQLRRVRDAAARHGAEVLVVSIPVGAAVSEQDLQDLADAGFRVDPATLHGDALDQPIAHAASAAGVPFVSPVEAFRAAARDEALYVRHDAHFAAAGSRVFAKALMEPVREALGAVAQSPTAPDSP